MIIIIIMSSETVNFKVVSHEDRVFNISPTETINDFRRVLAKELFESEFGIHANMQLVDVLIVLTPHEKTMHNNYGMIPTKTT